MASNEDEVCDSNLGDSNVYFIFRKTKLLGEKCRRRWEEQSVKKDEWLWYETSNLFGMYFVHAS